MTAGVPADPPGPSPLGAGEPAPAVDVPAGLRAAAEASFGDQLPLAYAYARLLATDGVVRGLIGPKETPRLWDRHLLNCAVVAELIPDAASVVDVGSGAGLPGVALALARPDLSITLLEPMQRRVTFLDEVVAALDLTARVAVVRARAEEAAASLPAAQVAVARALAPLDRLAGWCLPLTTLGGQILAIKGASAEREVAAHQAAVRRLGGSVPELQHCGVGVIDPPTTVVEIHKERESSRGRGTRTADRRRGGRSARRR